MTALIASVAAIGTVLALAAATGAGRPAGGRRVSESAHGRADQVPSTGQRRSAGPSPALVVCVVALVMAVAAVAGPVVAGTGVMAVGVARLRAGRRAVRKAQRSVDSAVPDLIDLFVIAAAAGHPVAACLVMVADRAPEPLRSTLADARASLAHGMPLADALRIMGTGLGVLGPSLTGALATSAATGAPLGPALRDVAVVARDRRRRDAENEARRLPVTLLFPLVCCILPAFVLLAVVPLLAASLAALDL